MVINEIFTNIYKNVPVRKPGDKPSSLDIVRIQPLMIEIQGVIDALELIILTGLIGSKNIKIRNRSIGSFDTFLKSIFPKGNTPEEFRSNALEVWSSATRLTSNYTDRSVPMGMVTYSVSLLFTGQDTSFLMPNLEKTYTEEKCYDVIKSGMDILITNFSKALVCGDLGESKKIQDVYICPNKYGTSVTLSLSAGGYTIRAEDTYGHCISPKMVKDALVPSQFNRIRESISTKLTLVDLAEVEYDRRCVSVVYFDNFPEITDFTAKTLLTPEYRKLLDISKRVLAPNNYSSRVRIMPTTTCVDAVMEINLDADNCNIDDYMNTDSKRYRNLDTKVQSLIQLMKQKGVKNNGI